MTSQERCQRDADARRQSSEQLGLYGDGCLGLEPEGLVRLDRAAAGRRNQLLNMEFRKFLRNLIWIPTQILKHGRRTVYRILNHNGWTSDFFSAWESIKKLRLA
jgi:hypothetical protein